MTEHYRLISNIDTKLGAYVYGLKLKNDQDYFDENKEAEYFFCEPLSLLFGACVTNANDERPNCPSVDLWDKQMRIAFQITSIRKKSKVQHTLDEFFDHDMDVDFDRLIVLIVSLDDLQSFANLTFKRPFDFNPQRDVWNICTLAKKFKTLPFRERHKLQAFSDYLDSELGLNTKSERQEKDDESNRINYEADKWKRYLEAQPENAAEKIEEYKRMLQAVATKFTSNDVILARMNSDFGNRCDELNEYSAALDFFQSALTIYSEYGLQYSEEIENLNKKIERIERNQYLEMLSRIPWALLKAKLCQVGIYPEISCQIDESE